MKERLQKVLARGGYGSRRSSETLITAGRVHVNGAVVTELGTQVDPEIDRVEVDGEALVLPSEHVYVAMNKPRGFVTTARDPQRRRTVMELLPENLPPHVFPVGRLDRDTEGLLIFTNDGEFAHRMTHPRYQIEKEYVALVQGRPSGRTLRQLEGGVVIDGEETAPARAELATEPEGFEGRPQHTWVRLVIHEGRKRQVRRMLGAVGHEVRTLVRVRVGAVQLARLGRGKTRRLTAAEVHSLKEAVGLAGT